MDNGQTKLAIAYLNKSFAQIATVRTFLVGTGESHHDARLKDALENISTAIEKLQTPPADGEK